MPQPLAPVDLGSSVASNAATSGIRRPSLAGPAPPPFAPCPPSLSLFLLAPTIASSGSPSRVFVGPRRLVLRHRLWLPTPLPSPSLSPSPTIASMSSPVGLALPSFAPNTLPSTSPSPAPPTARGGEDRSSAKRQTVEMKLLPSKRSGGTKRSGSASVHDEAIAIQQLMRGTCIRGEVRWESVKEQIY
ncbi:RNA-dependent RNA polymerase [Musa troglodytarum]|uniref:RNA-dependent RNA polymerase n=1 Tax=Musa troglodytarum TaxID=320322 RepID=A0A9E7IEI3_9LILI|nr:RNA-dependent RNA polymerase [Musa troglodytarum]URE46869.1 RNA-dependent RNA polymerase [Musa troglodytarum]URE46871.1 RNA-dependent RNA polymerase [Musa troglodytarum]URE46876.1 RNA-dependent RNA polymerase [Musa troglodytarum]